MKIGIIGSGFVGSATAFNLIMSGVAHEVLLIDKDTARAEAEAIDIIHATPCGQNNRIVSGDYLDLKNSDIVILTAGANQKPGQTRLDLLKINVSILKKIVPQIVKYAPDAILLIASNPADIMTAVMIHLSGFPKEHVICSGTVLDSARFRVELGQFLGISTENINAYVLGEHGDHEVLAWDEASIGIMSVHDYGKIIGKSFTDGIKAKIDDAVRNAAYKIIDGKRATFYGIAGALTKICKEIAMDSHAILPISSLHDEIFGAKRICLSVPTIVCRRGIERVLYPTLSEQETESLRACAKVIEDFTKQAMSVIEKN